MSREQHIQNYFEEGYTYPEITSLLSKYHDIAISLRQLCRILKKMRLKRKNITEDSLECICSAMIDELGASGSCLGYKSMWRRLSQTYGLKVRRETVYEILHLLDPEGIENRQRHRLTRRKYKVPGPNFLWHVDGYDKLKPFGFAIHGCIDGFSRKMLWLDVATSNNKPEIIAYYFLNTLNKFKLVPTLMRSDLGTENVLIERLQQGLRFYHDDQLSGTKSFIKGKSTSNQRIESYWSQLRRQGADYWISFFKDMRDQNTFNDSDPIQVQCLRYCFGHLIKKDLRIIQQEWNRHRIRKQKSRDLAPGKPNSMFYLPERYNATDYAIS
ncbi:uncharacterized protein LOC107045241 [Diachasma alloeum]|uniref:uncharacterized protein LOC107045241 n=1 Tax=Diachasma alloeum TaxID=454923 RepID=UPI00073817FA|nr:uncharacterized protein LOC107045241 [Diachasma alloeum]